MEHGQSRHNHYADVNGNVYHNNGSGWQQHSSSGWGTASGDTSWADRESQARSTVTIASAVSRTASITTLVAVVSGASGAGIVSVGVVLVVAASAVVAVVAGEVASVAVVLVAAVSEVVGSGDGAD